jgi:hypothetical protein
MPRARFAILAAMILSAISARSPEASAASCKSWSAAVVEREEGKAMTASVCAPGADRDSILEVVCFGEQVNLRYLVVVAGNTDPKVLKQDFVVRTDKSSRRLFMQFEGLDGAFTAYLPASHPLFEAMMSGGELSLTATGEKLQAPTFTLKGSRQAIGKVIGGCRAG